VAVANAVFCAAVTAMYMLARGDPSPVVGAYLALGPPVTTLLWLEQDARQRRLAAVHDWGLFMYIAAPILLPWYAFKSRGRRGWLFLFAVSLLLWPAYVAALVVSIVFGVVR
jgi:hypothetical protein